MSMNDAIAVVRTRLRALRGQAAAARYFGVGAVAGIAVVLVRWVVAGEETSPWLLLLPVVAAAAGWLVGWWRRPAELDVAIALDQRLGLRECTSTATWYAGAEGGGDVAVKEALRLAAVRKLEGVDAGQIRRAFSARPPIRPLTLAIPFVLLFVLAPLLPSFGRAAAEEEIEDARSEVVERQKVREVARRLERRAADLEKIAAARKLELARRAAARLATQAREMNRKPPAQRPAMASLSRVGSELERQRDAALGRKRDPANGSSALPSGEMNRLARALENLGALDLPADLDAFGKDLEDEAARARDGGKDPKVDVARLERLAERARDAAERLADLESRLGENAPELAQLSERERRALERIAKLLEDFAGC